MNYQQLSEAIQSYVESTEQLFVFNIPNFVQLCEERVYNAVQIPAIRKNVIGNFTQSDHYLALPDDYLASFSLAVIDADGNTYIVAETSTGADNNQIDFLRLFLDDSKELHFQNPT